ELDAHLTMDGEVNAAQAPAPIAAGWTCCDESADRAEAMARQYIGGYYQSVLEHYQFAGDHLAKTRGYEYYGKMTEKIAQYGTDKVIDFFLGLQVWGTPEQCYARILDIRERVGNQAFVGVFSYAGVPHEEAGAPRRLVAREVTPELRKL